MSRIHPSAVYSRSKMFLESVGKDEAESPCLNKLTVWKRSSMAFQGTDGFTVFDRQGRLAFRVDNYSRTKSCSEGGGLVLMDGAGNALLNLRPQMWSIHSQWNAYRGESYSCSRSGQSMTKLRVFTLRRCSRHLFHSSKAEAEVFLRKEAACQTRSGPAPDFTIEGSFERRNCCIRSSSGEVVARITRKRVKNGGVVLSNDVFSLVIKPGFDAEMVMGFVIVLDRICRKSYGPVLCS